MTATLTAVSTDDDVRIGRHRAGNEPRRLADLRQPEVVAALSQCQMPPSLVLASLITSIFSVRDVRRSRFTRPLSRGNAGTRDRW